jgi:hypothetical protein
MNEIDDVDAALFEAREALTWDEYLRALNNALLHYEGVRSFYVSRFA